jgi:hypothetical protein
MELIMLRTETGPRLRDEGTEVSRTGHDMN